MVEDISPSDNCELPLPGEPRSELLGWGWHDTRNTSPMYELRNSPLVPLSSPL